MIPQIEKTTRTEKFKPFPKSSNPVDFDEANAKKLSIETNLFHLQTINTAIVQELPNFLMNQNLF